MKPLARRLALTVGVAAAAWMLIVGLLSPWLVPQIWTARNVPPKLRADRWELSHEGMRARELTEAACGALPVEAWLEFPDHALEPRLVDGPDALSACFAHQVAPGFSRDLAP